MMVDICHQHVWSLDSHHRPIVIVKVKANAHMKDWTRFCMFSTSSHHITPTPPQQQHQQAGEETIQSATVLRMVSDPTQVSLGNGAPFRTPYSAMSLPLESSAMQDHGWRVVRIPATTKVTKVTIVANILKQVTVQ
jgi:hypothetical protein